MKIDRLLDSSFLFARWKQGESSGSEAWLQANAQLRLGIPWIVRAQLLRAAEVARCEMPRVVAFVDRYPVLWPDEETLAIYASTFARLYEAGEVRRSHVLWIAASALQAQVPLVTCRRQAFDAIAGLKLESC